MKNPCIYSQFLGEIALLFVMAALCVKPSVAQKDLKILVSGPWSYVRDQANYPNRLILVAPAKDSQGHPSRHRVYVWQGTNVTANPQSLTPPETPKPVGIYTLDCEGGARKTPSYRRSKAVAKKCSTNLLSTTTKSASTRKSS